MEMLRKLAPLRGKLALFVVASGGRFWLPLKGGKRSRFGSPTLMW